MTKSCAGLSFSVYTDSHSVLFGKSIQTAHTTNVKFGKNVEERDGVTRDEEN